MARVLISNHPGKVGGDNKRILCFFDGLIQALLRNGNEVLHINSPDFIADYWNGENTLVPGVSLENELKKVDEFNPELVIAFNNSTLPHLDKTTNCPILLWPSDTFTYFNQKQHIIENKERYHFVCPFSSDVIEIQTKVNPPEKNIIKTFFGTDLRAEPAKNEYSLTFVGTAFNPSLILKQGMKESPALINLYLDYLSDREKFVNQFHQSLNQNFFNLGNLENLIQAFEAHASTQQRFKYVDAAMSYQNSALFGIGWEEYMQYSSNITKAFSSQEIFTLKENQDLYNTSKLGLNISHAQASVGFPWRVLDIMASNACLVSGRHESISTYFKKYVDIPMFSSLDEFRSISDNLLSNDKLRNEIVSASQDCINKEHRWENRFRLFEEVFSIKLLQCSGVPAAYLNIIPDISKDVNLPPLKRSRSAELISLVKRYLKFNQVELINLIKILLPGSIFNALKKIAKKP